MKLNSKTIIGLIYASLGALGFSMKAIFVKLGFAAGADVTNLLVLRMVMAVPFFIAAAWLGNRINRVAQTPLNGALTGKDWRVIIGIGILGYYLSSLFDFMGLVYISTGLERIILFLYPLMVVLAGWFYFHRPVRIYEITALVGSMAGIVLIFASKISLKNEANLALGSGLVFIATICFALYILATGQVVQRVGVLRFTASTMLVASVCSIVQFLVLHSPSQIFQQPHQVYVVALGLALFSTVLPVFMQSAGIKYLGAAQASIVGSLGPIATLFFADVFLGESTSAMQLWGSGLVIIAVASMGVFASLERGKNAS